MATRKYLSLVVFGIGLVLAGFAAFSSRIEAPVFPPRERGAIFAPSPARAPARAESASGSPFRTGSPAPSATPRNAPATALDEFLHAALSVSEKSYDLKFHDGETLYQAMRRLEGEGALSMEGKNFSGLGFFIEGFDGVRSGNGKYWLYSVNGVKASVGVEGYRPRAGDTIVWTFEEAYP